MDILVEGKQCLQYYQDKIPEFYYIGTTPSQGLNPGGVSVAGNSATFGLHEVSFTSLIFLSLTP